MSGARSPVAPASARDRGIGLALWAAPLAVFVWMYHDALRAWWMADDAMHLFSVIRHGVLAHFVRPNLALDLVPANVTPLLAAEYGVDYALGGLNPRIAYVHHLVVWLLTLSVLTVVLRRALSAGLACAALLLFVPTIPVGSVAQLLCTRHYLMGLLLAVSSIGCLHAYVRTGGRGYLWGSAAFYALAVTAKEIYVPLGPLLVVHRALFGHVSEAGWLGRRTRGAVSLGAAAQAAIELWPHLAVAVGYVFWRGYMLGWERVLRGYDDPGFKTRPEMVLQFPAIWSETLQWTGGETAAWAGLIAVGCAAWLVRASAADRWRGVVWGFCVLGVVLLPIYPVLARIKVNPHYLFLPVLVMSALGAWSIAQCARWWNPTPRTWARHLGSAAFAALLLVVGVAHYEDVKPQFWLWSGRDYIAQYRVEGEYELYSADRAVVADPFGPWWHHFALHEIRRRWITQAEGPSVCFTTDCAKAALLAAARGESCKRYASAPPRLEDVSCIAVAARAIAAPK